MRHLTATLAVLGILLLGCSGASREVIPSSSLPAPNSRPSSRSASDIQFVLQETYAAGSKIVVRIRNVGHEPYRYQPFYPACFLSFSDSSGREFIIPPGTHCDTLTTNTAILPGQTKRLFVWDLDECTNDQWGCVVSRALDPDTYTIGGVFRSLGEGSLARVRATFHIVSTS